jgi:hypothetical protein
MALLSTVLGLNCEGLEHSMLPNLTTGGGGEKYSIRLPILIFKYRLKL